MASPQLKTRQGCEYLMQYDTESVIGDWHRVIQDAIRQLVTNTDGSPRNWEEEDAEMFALNSSRNMSMLRRMRMKSSPKKKAKTGKGHVSH